MPETEDCNPDPRSDTRIYITRIKTYRKKRSPLLPICAADQSWATSIIFTSIICWNIFTSSSILYCAGRCHSGAFFGFYLLQPCFDEQWPRPCDDYRSGVSMRDTLYHQWIAMLLLFREQSLCDLSSEIKPIILEEKCQ